MASRNVQMGANTLASVATDGTARVVGREASHAQEVGGSNCGDHVLR